MGCQKRKPKILVKTKRKRGSYWYRRIVINKTLAICTRSLTGNLSLWSVVPNMSSLLLATAKVDAMNEE